MKSQKIIRMDITISKTERQSKQNNNNTHGDVMSQ